MPKLKIISAKKMLKWLHKKGFKINRQKGSHIRVTNGSFSTTIPMHGTDLPRGTIHVILKDLEIDPAIYHREN